MSPIHSEDLQALLQQFRGSAKHYPHWQKHFAYSEGVKFLADQAHCYWLLDTIADLQCRISRAKLESIQIWHLEQHSEGHVVLKCLEDEGTPPAIVHEVEHRDFPMERFKLYLMNRVLFLPSEY
ncbi:MAG: hypothetical protein NW224_13070 [Leptolyngbyaceae cyanobacterium bins.302]|nr:hypothetical protein [Leptolyngbyaceae cyanobacterium bins.302]